MKKSNKKQVASKLNKMLKDYQKKMVIEAEKILAEADMWYGLDPDLYGKKGKPNEKDRNGDQFVFDGVLEGDSLKHLSNWLHTRNEVTEALTRNGIF